MEHNHELESIDTVIEALKSQLYIADRSLATSIYLALKLNKPLFLEGEAGVGKTEVAKVLATLLDTRLIRLQCYEGLDVNTAVYEWNYSRQLIQVRLLEASGENRQQASQEIFSPEFLLKRPLLQAIEAEQEPAPVLLIDELDRADEEFEAFLLEFLSDFQITIPEIGTIRASVRPLVVLTSNRTREIHDALRRRCLYCWIEYPSFDKEYEIVRSRLPQAPESLARQVVNFVQALREQDLFKRPGVAETLDWVNALLALNRKALDEETVWATLGVLLKYRDDVELLKGERLESLVDTLPRS